MSQIERKAEAQQELPLDLEEMPPGPQLAAILASVDRRLLDDRDRVRLVQARNRMVAHLQGELYADIYAVSWGEPPEDGLISIEEPYGWTTTEVAMALKWTKLAAGVRLEQGRRMIEDLPAVGASLRAGVIDVPKALVIADGVAALELDVARPIVDAVLNKAPELTTGQLRVWLRRLVMAADPAAAAAAAKARSKGRRVTAVLNDNHLADLAGWELAPHRVAASWERLTGIAKAAKAAGDPRSIDELRADALLDLVVGEGVALGEPITDGGFTPTPTDADADEGGRGQHDTSPSAPAPPRQPAAGSPAEDRAGMGWPAAPADPSLLDPQADPPDPPDTPEPATNPPDPAATAPEVPGEHQQAAYGDAEHEVLRPFWLAGFDHLPTRRPNPTGQSGSAGPAGRGVMPAPRKGVLELHMSLYTLLGLDELPAELAGFGPMLADVARQVARDRPDLPWKVNVYHQGELLARATTNLRPKTIPDGPIGRRTKRRPTTRVAEFVRARNRTCVRPGCRRHSRSCEIDHSLAWSEGGESESSNLGPECTPDHQFRHSPGCRLIQSSNGGRFGWVTPKGMRYVTMPDPPLYDDLEIVDPCQ